MALNCNYKVCVQRVVTLSYSSASITSKRLKEQSLSSRVPDICSPIMCRFD